jgi:DNA-binding transcriptional LysR family regulator
MFPSALLLDALAAFQRRFPAMPTRLHMARLGGTAKLVLDGVCSAGVMLAFTADPATLTCLPLLDVPLAMVVAPAHPLAAIGGALSAEILRGHVQLVLTDGAGLTANRDFGVQATRTWRITDLGVKHALLRRGLGFGSMPRHMIEADLASGDLVEITLRDWDGDMSPPVLPITAAFRLGQPVGPATRWLIDRLALVPQGGEAEPVQSALS